MTSKTIKHNQWTESSDYGLPFVEITPLDRAYIIKKADEKVIPIDVDEVKKRTIQSIKPIFAETEKVWKSDSTTQEKRRNNSWIWIAAVLTLAVILVIVWQMNSPLLATSDRDDLITETTVRVAKDENADVAATNTLSKESQVTDNQFIISDSLISITTPSESSQTGTTIATNVSGTLVRISEKANRPQFYIIVGSLPNEAMALQEANQYMDRAEVVYLILPYEGARNYRLAIATSPGFTAINDHLAQIKDQYKEDLWILKY